MKHLFYFLGILYMLYEMTWILGPKDKVASVKKRHELFKKEKGLPWEQNSKEFKNEIYKFFIKLPFFLWPFVGLLTFNWLAFAFKIAFNFIVIAPLSRITRFSFAYTVLHWVNSIIGLAFAAFVIINAYHLKIDLYQALRYYFNL